MENSVVFGIFTLAAGLISTFFTIRMNRKSTMEQNVLTGDNNLVTQYKDMLKSSQDILDQVQEEREAKAKEIAEMRQRLDQMEEREKQRIQRQILRDGSIRRYVEQLHQDIYNQLPPPPRAVPDGLFD